MSRWQRLSWSTQHYIVELLIAAFGVITLFGIVICVIALIWG